MGQILCCVTNKDNPNEVNQSNSPPIQTANKEKLKYKKPHNSSTRKKAGKTRNFANGKTNKKENEETDLTDSSDLTNIHKLSNEIQEKMFDNKSNKSKEVIPDSITLKKSEKSNKNSINKSKENQETSSTKDKEKSNLAKFSDNKESTKMDKEESNHDNIQNNLSPDLTKSKNMNQEITPKVINNQEIANTFKKQKIENIENEIDTPQKLKDFNQNQINVQKNINVNNNDKPNITSQNNLNLKKVEEKVPIEKEVKIISSNKHDLEGIKLKSSEKDSINKDKDRHKEKEKINEYLADNNVINIPNLSTTINNKEMKNHDSNSGKVNNDKAKNNHTENFKPEIIGGRKMLRNKKNNVKYLNVEIFVDHLDLEKFETDVYGPYFNPYMDITFNNEKSKPIHPSNQQDNSRNESFNLSGISNIEGSMNTSNNQSIIMNSSKLGNFYSYKELRKFSIDKKRLENFDVNIEFSLRNNCKFKGSASSNKDASFDIGNNNIPNRNNLDNNSNLNISGASKSNSNNSVILNSTVITSDNIPIVLIGSGLINLNKLYSESTEKVFESYLEIRLRKTILVGYLKLCIYIEELDCIEKIYSNRNTQVFDENNPQSEFIDWLEKNNLILDDNTNFDNNMETSRIRNIDDLRLWENNAVNATELPDMICEDFFNPNFYFLQEQESEINSKASNNNKFKIQKKSPGLNKSNNVITNNSNIVDLIDDNSSIRVIGINKKNYISQNTKSSESIKSKNNSLKNTDNSSINSKSRAFEKKIKYVQRVKIEEMLQNNKTFAFANQINTNIKDFKFDENYLKNIFIEDISSQIIINKTTGHFELNEININKTYQGFELTKYNMYQFLLNLIILTNSEKYDILIKFFNSLKDEEKGILVQITNFDKFNIFIFKNYLQLMSNYILYHKNNQVSSFQYFIFFISIII